MAKITCPDCGSIVDARGMGGHRQSYFHEAGANERAAIKLGLSRIWEWSGTGNWRRLFEAVRRLPGAELHGTAVAGSPGGTDRRSTLHIVNEVWAPAAAIRIMKFLRSLDPAARNEDEQLARYAIGHPDLWTMALGAGLSGDEESLFTNPVHTVIEYHPSPDKIFRAKDPGKRFTVQKNGEAYRVRDQATGKHLRVESRAQAHELAKFMESLQANDPGKPTPEARTCVSHAIEHGLEAGKEQAHAIAYAYGKCRSEGYESLGPARDPGYPELDPVQEEIARRVAGGVVHDPGCGCRK